MNRRRTGTREKDTIVLVGSAGNCPDLAYATGFRAPDDVVYVGHGNGFLVVPGLELGRATRVCGARGVEVLTPEMLKLKGRQRRRMSEWVVRLVKRLGVNRVKVPASFPYQTGRRLEKAGLSVGIASKALFPGRATKDPEELAKIKESQQAAVIAMRMAMERIARSGIDASGHLKLRGKTLTSEGLRREIAGVLLEHDCFCRDIIVAGGKQAADPHEQGSGPLRAGETIVIDIFPQHLDHGYWGDLTRTVVRGPASAPVKRMYHAVRAAQAAALSRIRAGAKCSSVHRAAVMEFERRGYKTRTRDGRAVGFIHGTGHGVGLAVHEAPSVSMNDDRLQAGNVITVEPGLYYPDLGGIRIEDMVVVTATGWKHVVPCEKRFEV